jgi:hypothetical protein
MFSLQQNWRTRGKNTFCLEVEDRGGGGWGEGGLTMYTHVSKCKYNKIFKNIRTWKWGGRRWEVTQIMYIHVSNVKMIK